LPHELDTEVTPTSTEEWLHEATRQLREGNEELAESIYLMKVENNRDAFHTFRNEFYKPVETYTSDEGPGAAPKEEDAPAEQPEPRIAEVVQEKSLERDTETAYAEKLKSNNAEETPEPEVLQPVVKTTQPKKKKKQPPATPRFFSPPSDESIEKKFAQQLFHTFSKERLSALLKLPRIDIILFLHHKCLSKDKSASISLIEYILQDKERFKQFVACLVDDYQLLLQCDKIIALLKYFKLSAHQKILKNTLEQLCSASCWMVVSKSWIQKYHWAPIHLAASKGECDLLKKLHQLGANFNKLTQTNATPCHLAILGNERSTSQTLHTLHRLGTDVRITDKDGMTPFATAAESNDLEALCTLYDMDSSVINQPDIMGRTPAYWAGIRNHEKVLNKLHQWGVEITNGDNKDSAPDDMREDLGAIAESPKVLGVS
jgi:hypothetical protein